MASSGRKSSSRIPSGPIAFFLSIILVVIGLIQLVSTFHTYATNLAELNSLRKTQAALIERNQDLQNDIARWSDDEYVAAQARERLGFVFPGEQAIRVLHPEAVTGGQSDSSGSSDSSHTATSLPWYKELSYAFEQADQKKDDGQQSADATDGNASGSSGSASPSTASTDASDSNTTKDNQQ